MLRRSSLRNFPLALATALLLAAPAQALLVLTLDDPGIGGPGVPEVIVADNQPAGVSTAAGLTTHADPQLEVGFVTAFDFVIGPFSEVDATGSGGARFGGSPTRAVLSLFVGARSDGPGTILASVTDTDYALATQPETHDVVFLASSNTPGTVSARANLDPSNAEFGPSPIAVVLPSVVGFEVEGTVPAPLGAAPFSLSQQVRIVQAASGGYGFAGGYLTVELPCPCFGERGPLPTYCFDRHTPSLNSWAYTFPGSFLQVTNLWCRDNGLFKWISPGEAIACDAALHERCDPEGL